jgi:integrase
MPRTSSVSLGSSSRCLQIVRIVTPARQRATRPCAWRLRRSPAAASGSRYRWSRTNIRAHGTHAFHRSAIAKTWRDYYKVGIKNIRNYKQLADTKLEEITSENSAELAAFRRAQGLQVSTVNSSLQVLRRMLRLSVEWGVCSSAPLIRMLPGERHREHVVSPEEEIRYLAAAPEPLASVAAILVDTGLRPEECFRLRWESVTWSNGRHGTFLVTHGKTAASRRVLPMTPRVRMILESRWEHAAKPVEGWIWPAPTRSGHLESSSLKKQHARTFREAAAESKRNNLKPVRPFVLYSLRHTFLTRLGESGCDAWTLARIAGHSSVAMSTRYVHPSGDAVLEAISRLGGHKIRHSKESGISGGNTRGQLPS